MHNRIYNLLTEENEVTWQSILYDLIKKGELNPSDINISLLSKRYLQTIKQMQELNLFVSGKILLASAILLRLKSDKILTEGIPALDNIMFPPEPELEDFNYQDTQERLIENPKLTIKTPQARKKKVTVTDLISALEKALEVHERKILRKEEQRRIPEEIFIPKKSIDISLLIKNVYGKIRFFFTKKQTLTFTELVDSDKKQDKLYTFLPLLHLDAQNKIDLNQEEHFGEIDIKLP